MKQKKINSNTLLLIITIVLFVFMYAAGCVVYNNKGFGHLQTFLNLLINNAGLLCVACGMTCIMLTGGIDISVGSLIALDCMILAAGMENWNMSAPALCILVLVIGVVFGMVQGFCVGYLKIQPFIVTMAGMFFGRGMTAVICTDQVSISNEWFVHLANIKIEIPFGGYVNPKGIYQTPFIRLSVLVALLVLVAVFLMLRYTKFGRSLYAVGGNAYASRLSGISDTKITVLAYVFSGFTTALGGIVLASMTQQCMATTGSGYETEVITAAVIGGVSLLGGEGTVSGALFGAILIGLLNNGLNLLSVPSTEHGLVKGIVIIIAVGFDALQHQEKFRSWLSQFKMKRAREAA